MGRGVKSSLQHIRAKRSEGHAVDVDLEDQRKAALAAWDANQLSAAYRLWLPLAEVGDAEAQAFVGSLLLYSLHRYESFEQLNSGNGQAIDEATRTADQEQAVLYLEAASAAGHGPASFNLAGHYSVGCKSGTWEERKARAAELYALAHAQGFMAFSHMMNDTAPGQPYLDAIEKQMMTDEKLPPPDWWNGHPCDSAE
jgi:TPR repeat protein